MKMHYEAYDITTKEVVSKFYSVQPVIKGDAIEAEGSYYKVIRRCNFIKKTKEYSKVTHVVLVVRKTSDEREDA